MKKEAIILNEFYAETGSWELDSHVNVVENGCTIIARKLGAQSIHLIHFQSLNTCRLVFSDGIKTNTILNYNKLLNLLTKYNNQTFITSGLADIKNSFYPILQHADKAIFAPVEVSNQLYVLVIGLSDKSTINIDSGIFFESICNRFKELIRINLLQKRFEKVNERFLSIVNTINQAVILIDNQGYPGWANLKAANLIGLPQPGEQHPADLAVALQKFKAKADNVNEIEAKGNTLFHTSVGPEEQWLWKFIDASNQVFQVSSVIIKNREVSGRLWVFEDITFNYLANKKLSLLNTKLEQETVRADAENKAKTDFLSNMSHEIRTPMAGILGIVNILGETSLDNEQKEHLNTIQVSAQNLMVIINDILDYNKIIAGKITLEEIEFSVYKTIHNALNILQFKAKEKNLEIKTEIHKDILIGTYIGDPYRLSQILINILGNAVKFTERGFIKLTCYPYQTGDMSWIYLEIKDTGIGMAQSQVNSIFERFNQADSSTARVYGGTGLGMSITKQLIDLTNGRISVTSSLNEGSTFILNIPYKRATESTIYNFKSLEIQLNGKKIILAEDNNINQKIASKALLKIGIDVTLVNNGKEALNKLETEKFDLILMDIQMPIMNGFETTKAIRNNIHGLNHRTPIIAMSASTAADEIHKCNASGMNGFISKPFQPLELYAVIAKHINS